MIKDVKTRFSLLLVGVLLLLNSSCKKENEPVSPILSKISTESVTEITGSTAVCGGTISSDGGSAVIARGICWSKNPHPTVENDTTINGAGTGSFVSNLSGLAQNTTCYIRAYAINKIGISYGNEVTFVTINGFIEVSAGGYHVLAIRADGTFWAWGDASAGAIGNGSSSGYYYDPQLVSSGYLSVSAGDEYSIGLKTDGTLWAWGINNQGSLGDGTTGLAKTSPEQIGSGFKTISAGLGRHTLALKQDGSLWAWGVNSFGALGDGTTTDKNLPVKIGDDFESIAAGGVHSLGVKTDGTLWAWGDNGVGEIGIDSVTYTPITTPILIDSGYTMVAAGFYNSLALKMDGTLWAWGGFGNATPLKPTQIGSGFIAISSGYDHSLALKSDGSLWAWGDNEYGQLGNGQSGPNAFESTPVQIGFGYVAISAGEGFSLAIKTDGILWAWGSDNNGQLGIGPHPDFSYKATPVMVKMN